MKKFRLNIISHTHWDREWYKSFQSFRFRLVELIDGLIDLMNNNPDYQYFHLDGQTIVLEDYLEIRPEKQKALKNLIESGRLLVGPFYNLPDEFLVSGESLIRNLILGHKIAREFGGVMKIGYIPDTFGHISQMPQIMQGFNIDNCVLFRGITEDQVKSNFIWIGSDNSQVLVCKMSDELAYSNYFYQLIDSLKDEHPINYHRLLKEIKLMISEREDQASTDELLCMDGVDHVFPNPKTPEIISWINNNMNNIEAEQVTFPEYITRVKDYFNNQHFEKLDKYQGELRISNRKWRLQALLAGVLSSRIHLKQQNSKQEKLLEKWIEPVSAFRWLLGDRYPSSYIWKSWKYILKNHPHDSICGCSIDQVHKDMIYRFDQARLINHNLLEQGLDFITRQINTEFLAEDEIGLVVFNPLSWARTDIVYANIKIAVDQELKSLRIFDDNGEMLEYQVIKETQTWERNQERYDIPRIREYKKIKIVFEASVPPLGYSFYRITVLDKPIHNKSNHITGPDSFENQHLKVTINPNGTIDLLEKESNSLYQGLLYFEDGGDAGDGYNYIKPSQDEVFVSQNSKCRISFVENGPLVTTCRITVLMELPIALHNDGLRKKDYREFKIDNYISIKRGSKRLDIKTVINNNIEDHRLRVCFPTGIDADYSWAESQFDIVSRPIETPDCNDWIEPQPPFHPQRSFVDINNNHKGLTIINQGLPEYEIKGDLKHTIALTLLRAVGGGVAHREQLKKGQCQGRYVFHYSVFPHNGDTYSARVWKEAYNHNLEMKAIQTGRNAGYLSRKYSFISIKSDDILLSALKKCERRDSLIIRFLNIANQSVHTEIAININIKEIYLVNLNEERKEQIDFKNDETGIRLKIEFSPKKMKTLEVIKQ